MSKIHLSNESGGAFLSHVVRGHPFPYRTFSCAPLVADGGTDPKKPVGFLLRRGFQTTIVTPHQDGSNAALWNDLMAEMAHWHVFPTNSKALPPEYWYG